MTASSNDSATGGAKYQALLSLKTASSRKVPTDMPGLSYFCKWYTSGLYYGLMLLYSDISYLLAFIGVVVRNIGYCELASK